MRLAGKGGGQVPFLTRETRVIIVKLENATLSLSIRHCSRLVFRFIYLDITYDITSIPATNKSFPRKAAIDHRAQKNSTRELLRPSSSPGCKNTASRLSPMSIDLCIIIARFSCLLRKRRKNEKQVFKTVSMKSRLWINVRVNNYVINLRMAIQLGKLILNQRTYQTLLTPFVAISSSR